MSKTETIDEYIQQFSEDIRVVLLKLRQVIKEAVPEATEKISWDMPTFVLHGNLIHFACFKHHIGLYPGADAIVSFKERISEYKNSKGTIQFPLYKPLPIDLIRDIVMFNVKANTQEVQLKLEKRTKSRVK